MSINCRTYPDERMARDAVRNLMAVGGHRRDLRLVVGTAPHDIRREPVGSFAGALPPDAPVGTFAAPVVRRLRRQGRGAFAGDPDRQRQGSFADVERDVVVTFARDGEHPRVAGHRRLEQMLRSVSIDRTDADHLIGELHAGHGLVLYEG
jgi:hypothetical protein